MKKLLLAFLLFAPVSAWAVCPTPLTIKDAAGATQNISTTDDGGGNCQSNVVDTAGDASLATIATNSALPWPAGTNIGGRVGIDQTTPGTTNAVTKTPMTPAVADAATSKVVLASATATVGLVWAHAENYSATNGFLVVYNATSAPSTGALTASLILACMRLPGSGYADIQRNPGLSASVGVVLLVTSASTCATYTTGTITANLTGAAS